MATDRAESGASISCECDNTGQHACPLHPYPPRGVSTACWNCGGRCIPCLNCGHTCKADLERVTAELAETKALLEGQADRIDVLLEETRRWGRLFAGVGDRAEQAEAERDAMREVEQAARQEHGPGRRYWDPECVVCGALARLDATRKATADAAR